MMQLASAESRLANPVFVDQPYDRFGTLAPLDISLASLVVRLAAQAHMFASPRHAQPFDEVLREDLPEGFFTTRTP